MQINLSQLIAPIYHDAFFSDSTYLILAGGRNSAKGDFAYTKAAVYGCTRPQETYVFSGQNVGMYKKVGAQNKKILTQRLGIPWTDNESKQFIRYNNDQSTIFFESLNAKNSKASVENFKGYDAQTDNVFVIFDELAIINDFARVDAIIKSFIARNNCKVQFIFIFNPPKNKKHPIFTFVETLKIKDNCTHLKTTIFDLPKHWFSPSIWSEIEHDRVFNPKQFDHEWMGNSTGIDGMPFANFASTQVVSPHELANENIIHRWTVIDVGISDSMVFSWYVRCSSGNVYKTSCYEYSGRETGKNIPYSVQAQRFKEWYHINKEKYGGVATTANYCDGLAFATELQHIGFKVINLDGKKDRAQSYAKLKHLIYNKRFFIIDLPENQIAIQQLENVEVEYAIKGGEEVEVIARPNNENAPIEQQIHHVDTDGYFAHMVFKRILK